MSAAAEVFPGIYRIELPLPFELESVNIHLVRLDNGYMLADCGMNTDASFEALQRGLAAAGIEWPDIRHILLTHMHPDHMGLSARLIALTGARLTMHEAEARQLEIVNNPERRAGWIGRAFNESGVPQTDQSQMHEHFLRIRKNFHALSPDELLRGGEEIPTAVGPFQVIWTPGHSPGHVCLYSARHRILISGDQILPKITPNISWLPGRDALADFLASLGRLRDLEIDLILPSHGLPFSGHRAWIDETTQHHVQRCQEIQVALAGAPRTAYSLVDDLWRKQLSPINRQFALLEVLAHLEYMRGLGQVRSEERADAWLWCIAD